MSWFETFRSYVPGQNQDQPQPLINGTRPLTAAEIQEHPEYPHAYWDLKADKREKIDVAAGRGGPFKLAYELHGHGPIKVLWIMGLGGLLKTWQRQTKDFGHAEADKYTCLVFDNRGIGQSDKPVLRYTTSQMAQDVVELLDHVGWKDNRSVHVNGISMGGMIAQELVSKSAANNAFGLLICYRVSKYQREYAASTSYLQLLASYAHSRSWRTSETAST